MLSCESRSCTGQTLQRRQRCKFRRSDTWTHRGQGPLLGRHMKQNKVPSRSLPQSSMYNWITEEMKMSSRTPGASRIFLGWLSKLLVGWNANEQFKRLKQWEQEHQPVGLLRAVYKTLPCWLRKLLFGLVQDSPCTAVCSSPLLWVYAHWATQ